jgi:ABC-type Na+ efflux pump, permease component
LVELDFLRGGARRVVAGREIRSLLSEKTIVLALVIQLFVAGFSSFLVVGLVSLYSPSDSQAGLVDTAVAGDDTDDLVQAVQGTPGLGVQQYTSREAARGAFERGDVDAALLGVTTGGGRVAVTVLVPDSNIETTLIVTQVRTALRTYERAERTQRGDQLTRATLDPPPRSASSNYFGFTYTVLVPLLLFLPVFIGGSITVDSLTEEIDRGTLELLRVAPVTLTEIVEGKLLAAAAITPVQAVTWMVLLEFNGTPIANLPWLVLLVGGATVVVIVLGVTLAIATPDRRVAQTLYSVLTLGVFGVAALSPLSPVNAAARLAIGTPAPASYLTSVAVAVVGVVLLVGVRTAVPWERVLGE